MDLHRKLTGKAAPDAEMPRAASRRRPWHPCRLQGRRRLACRRWRLACRRLSRRRRRRCSRLSRLSRLLPRQQAGAPAEANAAGARGPCAQGATGERAVEASGCRKSDARSQYRRRQRQSSDLPLHQHACSFPRCTTPHLFRGPQAAPLASPSPSPKRRNPPAKRARAATRNPRDFALFEGLAEQRFCEPLSSSSPKRFRTLSRRCPGQHHQVSECRSSAFLRQQAGKHASPHSSCCKGIEQDPDT